MNKKATAGRPIVQTIMLICEPDQVNKILAELAGVGASILSVNPIYMGAIDGQEDVMIVYMAEHEGGDAQFAHLSWVEDTLGPFCKVY